MDGQIFLASSVAEAIPIVAIVGGMSFALIISIAGMVGSHLSARERERTKREIAAYIAEGSMTPEEGERLIRAESPADKKKSCWWS